MPGAICCTWVRVCNPCLGEETTTAIFLSGDVAIPSALTDQFAGTDTTQFPSGFFTGFESAATAHNDDKSIPTTKKYLFIIPPVGDIVRCPIYTGQLSLKRRCLESAHLNA